MTATPPPRRTGRPRAFDPDTVLGCAMDLFWRHGYDHASVPELSAATGLSTSSIYNAFGSKRELYLAALDRYLEMTRAHMLNPMADGHEGSGDIQAFLDRLAAFAADPDGPRGCLVTKAIAEFGHRDPDVAERTQRYLSELRTALAMAFQRAAHQGTLPAEEVDGRADALLGIVLAFNLLVGAGAPPNVTSALLDGGRSLAHAG